MQKVKQVQLGSHISQYVLFIRTITNLKLIVNKGLKSPQHRERVTNVSNKPQLSILGLRFASSYVMGFIMIQ